MFSVIIPLFNKEVTVATTIESVLNQSFQDFEVIIINDGSTDQSLEIASSFKDDRIQLYSQQNLGVSQARNYGIRKAKRSYLAFLDADDIWDPGYLWEMQKLIKKYKEYAVFTCAYRVITQNRNSIKCDGLPEGIIKDFFEERTRNHIMRTSAVVVHRAVIEKVGGFPVGMVGGEDDFTWAKIAINYQIVFTPKVMMTYDNRNSTFNQRRGKPDSCCESWLDLYETGNYYRNEFIAMKALSAGIRHAYGYPQQHSRRIEKATKYTILYKKKWRQLYVLNRLPYFMIPPLRQMLPVYKQTKSKFARVGKNIAQKTILQLI
ncbi:glycosyltransferase family 2 protein [Pontibacter flavimaris]|uniref:Glycosyltransferase 2-like domain-containing protein n=1 Tax=Pontibacter flavimaris TaxID=1797110 RepID=A0A1Q5PBF8_9BACT|nr:glycosyltransferase family A protein [Pontibacter flavimaris]OKL39558.1 hypothetical protein A3841_01010 [Pontibacter flavimaris]